MITCEIDFATEGDDIDFEVAAWRDEFAPNCDAEVLSVAPNAHPVVRLSATSSRVLHDALLTFCGGDNAAALEILRNAEIVA